MAKVLIKTSEGDIKVRLYDETPQHRANFLKLAKERDISMALSSIVSSRIL